MKTKKRETSSDKIIPLRPSAIPRTPSPLDHPSSEELQSFPGAVVIEALEMPVPESAQKIRLRILKTNFKSPLIRTEEIIDADTGTVLERQEMVANQVLVKLPENKDPQAFLNRVGNIASSLERVTPDGLLYRLTLINGSLEDLPTALEEIARTEAIFAEPNFIMHANKSVNDPKYFYQWGLWKGLGGIDAYEGWDIQSKASSVIVGIIDSGIRYTHHDLAANIWQNPNPSPARDIHGWNACKDNGDPLDYDGHGTSCAGIVGAIGNNGIGISGVAWKVQLMACKHLNEKGVGESQDGVKCIDYAIHHGATILNCSFGFPSGYSESIFEALQRAQKAGVIVVVAAGNDGRNVDEWPSYLASYAFEWRNYPANYALDNIVSVAASSWFDELDSESNYGGKTISIAAPGVYIYSTWNESDDSYGWFSGTSMAAPFVTGALALLKERYPLEPYQNLIAHLLATADRTSTLTGKVRSGRLNLGRLLQTPLE